MKTYQRGKVHWAEMQWPDHPDADNKGRIRKPLDTDKRIAEVKLADLIKQRDASRRGFTLTDTSWVSFKKRYEAYLEAKTKYATRMHHNRTLREIEIFFPHLKNISEITVGKMEDFHTHLLQCKLGKYMVVKIIKSAKAIMRRAEIWQLCPPQDWKAIKTGKLPRGRLDFYTHSEIKTIYKEMEGLWLTAVHLGVEAGLRPAEIYHLRKEDILFKDKKIVIDEKHCDYCPVKFHADGLWTVKDNEKRAVDLKDSLADYLKKWMSKIKGEWLISEPSGWRPTFEGFTNTLGYKLRVIVGRGSTYTLRHTYAAHEIQEGRDIRKVRDNMGHDSIITTEIYTHLPPA